MARSQWQWMSVVQIYEILKSVGFKSDDPVSVTKPEWGEGQKSSCEAGDYVVVINADVMRQGGRGGRAHVSLLSSVSH